MGYDGNMITKLSGIQMVGIQRLVVGCALLLWTACGQISDALDPIKQGVNPRVVEVVDVARGAYDGSGRDASLLSFYYNNRRSMTLKDVQYLSKHTYNGSTRDTILVDWASFQRLQTEAEQPGGPR
jgi:hypothetical protein